MVRIAATVGSLVLGIATFPGCTADHGAPRPAQGGAFPFKEVRVTSVENEDGTTPEPCPVEAGVFLAFLVRDRDPGSDRLTLRIAVGCEAGEAPGSLAAHALVETVVQAADTPEEIYEGAAIAECRGCGRGKGHLAVLMAVARAASEALEQSLAQHRVGEAPDDEVVRLLAAQRAEPRQVILAAIEEAGSRHIRAATASLLHMMEIDDQEVLLRAIGALGRIGDPSAVRALGRLATSPAAEIPHVALRAIADIGGNEARRALDVVASQTSDPVIAREARDLLEELEDGRSE